MTFFFKHKIAIEGLCLCVCVCVCVAKDGMIFDVFSMNENFEEINELIVEMDAFNQGKYETWFEKLSLMFRLGASKEQGFNAARFMAAKYNFDDPWQKDTVTDKMARALFSQRSLTMEDNTKQRYKDPDQTAKELIESVTRDTD